MKKIVKWILAILMILSLSNIGLAEKTICIATGEWPPFVSKDLKHYGVVNHIIAEAFRLGSKGENKSRISFFTMETRYNDGKTWRI